MMQRYRETQLSFTGELFLFSLHVAQLARVRSGQEKSVSVALQLFFIIYLLSHKDTRGRVRRKQGVGSRRTVQKQTNVVEP